MPSAIVSCIPAPTIKVRDAAELKYLWEKQYLTATGYLGMIIVMSGGRLDIESVKTFCQEWGIREWTFYRAKNLLIQDGLLSERIRGPVTLVMGNLFGHPDEDPEPDPDEALPTLPQKIIPLRPPQEPCEKTACETPIDATPIDNDPIDTPVTTIVCEDEEETIAPANTRIDTDMQTAMIRLMVDTWNSHRLENMASLRIEPLLKAKNSLSKRSKTIINTFKELVNEYDSIGGAADALQSALEYVSTDPWWNDQRKNFVFENFASHGKIQQFAEKAKTTNSMKTPQDFLDYYNNIDLPA